MGRRFYTVPSQPAIQLPGVEQITQPLEPCKALVSETILVKPDLVESLIELPRALLCIPFECKIVKDPGKLGKVGFIRALICAGDRENLELATRYRIANNLGQVDESRRGLSTSEPGTSSSGFLARKKP